MVLLHNQKIEFKKLLFYLLKFYDDFSDKKVFDDIFKILLNKKYKPIIKQYLPKIKEMIIFSKKQKN